VSDTEFDYDQLTNIINSVNEDKKSTDRRKRKDIVGRMATILSLAAWVIMIAVWVVLDAAAPEKVRTFTATFFRATFGTEIVTRSRWDYALVYTAYVMMLISLGASAIAFIFNKMRMKRKSDKYKVSIFVIGGITIIGLVVFLIRFWTVLF